MNIYILKTGERENELIPFLSEQRRQAVSDIKNAVVRREKIYAYALLRLALREYGISEPPVFNYGEHGKPFIHNSNIHFSISHAGGRTACVVSNYPIGLDIQDVRPLKADISGKICTPDELERVRNSSDPDFEICRLWCIKESVGKLSGKGFSEGFTGIESEKRIKDGLTFVQYENGFFTAVSSESPIFSVVRSEIGDGELFSGLEKLK